MALVKHETVKGGSAPFVGPKHEAAGGPPEPDVPDDIRSAESASLGKASSPETSPAPTLEVPKQHFKKCKNGISRSAGMALPEVLKLHPSQKERSNTDLIHIEISPSVYRETGRTNMAKLKENTASGKLFDLGKRVFSSLICLCRYSEFAKRYPAP